MNLLLLLVSLLLFVAFVTANEFNECGKPKMYYGLVYGGNETQKGEFPFLAALYHIESDVVFCGGTLISAKHVLTGKKRKFRK